MLILGRKPGESVKIGDNIVVHVTELQGGQVMLGFEAPRSVPIVRTELIGTPRKPSRGYGIIGAGVAGSAVAK
jgi:carbon storage regulator CsrA